MSGLTFLSTPIPSSSTFRRGLLHDIEGVYPLMIHKHQQRFQLLRMFPSPQQIMYCPTIPLLENTYSCTKTESNICTAPIVLFICRVWVTKHHILSIFSLSQNTVIRHRNIKSMPALVNISLTWKEEFEHSWTYLLILIFGSIIINVDDDFN